MGSIPEEYTKRRKPSYDREPVTEGIMTPSWGKTRPFILIYHLAGPTIWGGAIRSSRGVEIEGSGWGKEKRKGSTPRGKGEEMEKEGGRK